MDQWIHCLSLVERCRLWCSKDIIRSGIGDLSIIVRICHSKLKGRIPPKLWYMSNQNAGIYPQKLQSKWDVMEFGVSQLLSSSFCLPLFFLFLFLSSCSSFPFLFVPLSFREVPISWGPGSQKTKNDANIPPIFLRVYRIFTELNRSYIRIGSGFAHFYRSVRMTIPAVWTASGSNPRGSVWKSWCNKV